MKHKHIKVSFVFVSDTDIYMTHIKHFGAISKFYKLNSLHVEAMFTFRKS